ncbi:MAG: CRTAC1 family protein [Abditibacteriales bacterium]|nr:CRTAC1 family protein [Abditibacteriales bacterium]MDW8367657.1 CRTAC1 family protein [Abditibacteriales bacterium]
MRQGVLDRRLRGSEATPKIPTDFSSHRWDVGFLRLSVPRDVSRSLTTTRILTAGLQATLGVLVEEKRGVILSLILLALSGCTPERALSKPSLTVAPPRPTPAPAPSRARGIFRDVAEEAGLRFRWGHQSFARLNILETLGFGCAFLDYNGDERWDVLLVGRDRCGLFRNRGDGTFEDVTERAFSPAVAPSRSLLHGAAVADYDNDGRPDIFVSGYGRTILYHNEGNGTFRDVTRGSGLEARSPHDWTTSAAWSDVDGDGDLDLYVCRYLHFTPQSKQLCLYTAVDGTPFEMTCGPQVYAPQKGSLYRNEGQGRFRDVTREAGMADTHGRGLGALFCDFNDDGRPDLYVANDNEPGDLYLNLGRGRFKNIGSESGTAYGAEGAAQAGMGIDWGDYDNDGRFDLIVATFAGEPNSLYRNEGHHLFTDRSYQSGVGPLTLRKLAFGASFVDADNDGWLDLVFTNGHVFSEIEKVDPEDSYPQTMQFLRNLGAGRFQDASQQAGAAFARKIVGRGIAVGDYNADGRLDLLVVDAEGKPLLLRNESHSQHRWLSLRCLRSPQGQDDIGARVVVSAGGRRLVAEVRAGGSYLSTNAPAIHLGMGAATVAETVTVRWSNGKTTRFRNLPTNQAYRVFPDGKFQQTLP